MDGDIYKACAESRQMVSDCLEEFSVENGREERESVLQTAKSIEDYDSAGLFAYTMYACMLALADLSLSDDEAYKFYKDNIGRIAPHDFDKGFLGFIRTVKEVARHDVSATFAIKALFAMTGQTFKERTILELRKSYVDSDIFVDILQELTKQVSDKLIPYLINDTQKCLVAVGKLYTDIRALSEDYLVKYNAGEILTKLDDYVSDDGEKAFKEFLERSDPDSHMAKMISIVGSDAFEGLGKMIGKDIPGMLDGLVKIKKTALLLGALYMLIGTGRMSLEENKKLSDKITLSIKRSAEGVDKNAGILELEELDYTDVVINLN